MVLEMTTCKEHNSYCLALIRSLLASFLSSRRVLSVKYSIVGVIYVIPSSFTTVVTSFSCMDVSFSILTNTCLDKCAKLVDAILLKASAFLFLLRGTWLIAKLAKPLTRLLTFSTYLIIFSSLVTYVPRTWFATNLESTLTCTLRTPIYAAIPPDPSTHDDPSVKSVYGSYRVSTTDVSGGLSSGFSIRKSARICFLQTSLAVIIAIGCAWKYLCNLLAAKTSDRTSFSIGVLNSGKDFSTDLERNLFKLANFPLRLWTFLIVRGDGSCSTTSVFVTLNTQVINITLLMVLANLAVKALSTSPVEYPSRILSRCSAIDRGTPVMSDGCHANISKFSIRSEHSYVRPFADSVPPIATS
ncbi:hypothetical protein Tco_0854004 [Tanacetum coccineum]